MQGRKNRAKNCIIYRHAVRILISALHYFFGENEQNTNIKRDQMFYSTEAAIIEGKEMLNEFIYFCVIAFEYVSRSKANSLSSAMSLTEMF